MFSSNNDFNESAKNNLTLLEDTQGLLLNEEALEFQSENQRYEASLTAYEEILDINPYDTYAYSGKGDVLCQLGRFEQALAIYEQAIHLYSNNGHAYFGKGNALKQLGRVEEAVQAFEKARELRH